MPRSRRFRKHAHMKTQLSWSNEDIMNGISRSPTGSSIRGRDTGFPESFCGRMLKPSPPLLFTGRADCHPERNTTLPHPEANLSPGVILTEDDISVRRAIARHRASFLADCKPTPSLSLGAPITIHPTTEYCSSPISLDSTDKFPSTGAIGSLALAGLRGADHLGQQSVEPRSSRDGESVFMSSPGGSSAGNSPTHAPRSPKGRRRSFLKRLTHR